MTAAPAGGKGCLSGFAGKCQEEPVNVRKKLTADCTAAAFSWLAD
jgi:hypothetical protein